MTELQTYLERLETLYREIEHWIKALDPEARVHKRGRITLNELETGEYVAPTLSVRLSSGRNLRVLPRGCSVIGAAGWVNIATELGSEELLFVEDEAELSVSAAKASSRMPRKSLRNGTGWVWMINQLDANDLKLNRRTFQELLKVLNE